MNKEELLEKSRKQNKNVDLFEQQVIAKGGNMGYSIGILVATMLFAIEMFCNKTQNYSVMAVWTSMEATMFIYKYIKLKKSHELVFAIVFTFAAISFIVFHILTLEGVFNG